MADGSLALSVFVRGVVVLAGQGYLSAWYAPSESSFVEAVPASEPSAMSVCFGRESGSVAIDWLEERVSPREPLYRWGAVESNFIFNLNLNLAAGA